MNMSFGASLGTVARRKGRAGKLYDVGGGRMISARQIAMETGCQVTTVHARVQHGWKGADLLRPRREMLYDCGGGEFLTVKEIMRKTGLGESTVRSRMARGAKGKDLLRKERKDMAAPRSSTMVLACKLADAFPDRLPTTKEIRRMYPMAEGTAERWLAALRAARERG